MNMLGAPKYTVNRGHLPCYGASASARMAGASAGARMAGAAVGPGVRRAHGTHTAAQHEARGARTSAGAHTTYPTIPTSIFIYIYIKRKPYAHICCILDYLNACVLQKRTLPNSMSSSKYTKLRYY
jgi:hypothetical protein